MIKREYKKAFGYLLFLAIVLFFARDAFSDVTYSTSFPVNDGGPLRIAADREGNLYVTTQTSSGAKVWMFNKYYNLLGYINDFQRPVGIAVDRAKRVFVGDYKKGSIGVYNNSGEFLFYLGNGQGEFGHPNDITVDSKGNIYVSDSTNNVVKVYDPDGTLRFTIGGYGTADGQMIFPTGITVDEYAQELYVVDHLNIRIEVFDLSGNFKRKFTSSYLLRPQGIAVSNGRVYVVDIYHSSVKVFDTLGNYITSIGIYGSGPGEFILPVDVVISNGKMFVTDSGNQRVQVFNLNEPGLAISPTSLSFTTYENSTPSVQTIQVDADIQGTAQWTAIVDAPFPVTISSTSGTTPSSISVGIDTTGMAIGNYKGKLYLYANGTEYPVDINLTIKEIPRLVVNPSGIVMHYVKGGNLPFTALNISTTSDPVSWTAQADVSWLVLSTTSGTAPSSVMVFPDSIMSTFASGTYNANITVTAPDAIGSPITVPVTLQVISGGTIEVKTNLNEATFDITGPQNYSGSGTSWNVLDVPPGNYEITFGDVPGYRTPAPRAFTVTAGNTVKIEADYEIIRLANTIIAGKGPSKENDGKIRIFDINGNMLSEINALATTHGANVALADLNGDLSDEIIVSSGPAHGNPAIITVLKPDGTVLATKEISNTNYGARLSAGDIDGDGVSEIAVSMITKMRNRPTNVVDIYNYNDGTLNKKVTVYASPAYGHNGPLSIAMGDVNGDGRSEVILFDSGFLKVFGLNSNLQPYMIASKAITYRDSRNGRTFIKEATITAGDIDGDGKEEIILGYVNDRRDSKIKVLRADLTETGLDLTAFAGGVALPSLSAMDTEGNGIVEILAGKGASSSNDAVLRIIKTDGTVVKEIKAFDTRYGVNGAFGFIKR